MTTQEITNVSWRPGGDAPMCDAYQCHFPGCGASFPDHASLSHHIFSAHGNGRCEQLASALTMEDDWDYVCGCGARFASATVYALHAKDCPQANPPVNGLVWVVVNGFDLALFPWEDAAAAVAEAEAILQEKDAKPCLGLEVDVLPWEVATEADETTAWLASDEPDELALMAAELDALRLGLVKPLATAWADDGERIGVEFCERPYLF